ncbi:MAG: glycosyltransferase [Anaerolineaceae bacterium]|nr:glycosyltransferase [Anaerolineaceae bacterium]
MRVLLVGIGEFFHVGAFFKRSLEALGHECIFIDEQDYFRLNSWKEKIFYRLSGKRPLKYRQFNHAVLAACQSKPDIVMAIKGAWLSPHTLQEIKTRSNPILINYATDDPFNSSVSTPATVKSIPLYDIYVTTKQNTISDIIQAGGKNVTFIPFGYEPSLHFVEKPSTPAEQFKFSSDLSFIGAADQDRVHLFSNLLSKGLGGLSLYGGFWDRYPRFRLLYRGMVLGRDYRLATIGAKISLGLVRHANRDGHSMRTFEIPACGGFMLAERTEEHLAFFEEDKEAVFFSSEEELLDKISFYLPHDKSRDKIRAAGLNRLHSSGYTYTNRVREILDLVKNSFSI